VERRKGIFVIAGSEATKQSILLLLSKMDCFASLAMTSEQHPKQKTPAALGDRGF